MEEYSVSIAENPLGISFVAKSHDTYDSIILHEVAHDSLGHHLGLAIGDKLVGINGHSLDGMKADEISEVFNEQSLPFEATFSRDKTLEVHHNTLTSDEYNDSAFIEFESDLDTLTDVDTEESSCSFSDRAHSPSQSPTISPFNSEEFNQEIAAQNQIRARSPNAIRPQPHHHHDHAHDLDLDHNHNDDDDDDDDHDPRKGHWIQHSNCSDDTIDSFQSTSASNDAFDTLAVPQHDDCAMKPLQMDLIAMKRPSLTHDAQHSLNSLNSLDTPTAKLWNLGHSNQSNISEVTTSSTTSSIVSTPNGLRALSPRDKLPMETLNLTLLPTLVSQDGCLSDESQTPSHKSGQSQLISPSMNQNMYRVVSPNDKMIDTEYDKQLAALLDDPVINRYLELDPLGMGLVFDKYAIRSEHGDQQHEQNQNSESSLSSAQSENTTEMDQMVCLYSSNGLESGCHEFTVEILKCDVYKMEIGIMGRCDITGDMLADGGVLESEALKQRAVYGNELCSNSNYYVSINEDNKRRCYKDLASSAKIGWCTSDVIKVCIDLNRSKIKFMRNGSLLIPFQSISRPRRQNLSFCQVVYLSKEHRRVFGCIYNGIFEKILYDGSRYSIYGHRGLTMQSTYGHWGVFQHRQHENVCVIFSTILTLEPKSVSLGLFIFIRRTF